MGLSLQGPSLLLALLQYCLEAGKVLPHSAGSLGKCLHRSGYQIGHLSLSYFLDSPLMPSHPTFSHFLFFRARKDDHMYQRTIVSSPSRACFGPLCGKTFSDGLPWQNLRPHPVCALRYLTQPTPLTSFYKLALDPPI